MIVLKNARFNLSNGFDNPIRALVVDQGKIAALLPERAPLPADCEILDLRGAYVYPGFIDAHTHSFSGGLYRAGIDLSAFACLDDVLDALREADQETGGTIFAWRFDERSLREGRFPTQAELDSACRKRKLLLRRVDGHSCMLNSLARQSFPSLQEGPVLTGTDNDRAVNHLQDSCASEDILAAYHTAAEQALKGGFTRVHTMIGDAEESNQHYSLIRDHLADFRLDFELYPQSFNIADALQLGAKRVGGCILADGSLGSHTAALTQSYADSPTQGILYRSDSFWQNFIGRAHAAGLQICVHCIGDAAIRQINNAYATLPRNEVQALRHQLIHCELTPDPLLDDIAASGAVPVMQPAFDLLWGGDSGLYEQRLGGQRLRQMNRFGSFTRAGVRVCGSSDWYVTELNIALSLHALINHHNPAERLSPAEAIRIYTENNAWLARAEDRYGLIEPGFEADLSVMDTDFTQPFNYVHARTLRVIRRGETVYAAD